MNAIIDIMSDIMSAASSVKFESDRISGRSISKMAVVEWNGELFGIDQFIEIDDEMYESRILVKNIDSARTPAFKNIVEAIIAKIPAGDWDPNENDGMSADQKIEKYFGGIDGNWEFNIYASGPIAKPEPVLIPEEFKNLFPYSESMGDNASGIEVAFI